MNPYQSIPIIKCNNFSNQFYEDSTRSWNVYNIFIRFTHLMSLLFLISKCTLLHITSPTGTGLSDPSLTAVRESNGCKFLSKRIRLHSFSNPFFCYFTYFNFLHLYHLHESNCHFPSAWTVLRCHLHSLIYVPDINLRHSLHITLLYL